MAARETMSPLATEDPVAEQRRSRRGTIVVALIVAALITVIVLLTPANDGTADTRLTTLRYGPANARLFADLAKKLGWQVITTNAPLRGALDTTAIYAVFGGPTPMPTAERNAILSAVRRGAGLLVTPDAGNALPLLDSLGLRIGPAGKLTATPLTGCTPEADPLSVLRVRPMMTTFVDGPDTTARKASTVPYPAGATVLLSSDVSLNVAEASGDSAAADHDSLSRSARASRSASGDSSSKADGPTTASAPRDTIAAPDSTRPDSIHVPTEPHPTMIAFAVGRGRVVAIADPDILRTDQLRNCSMGSAMRVVRGLEYLSVARTRSLRVAEYYQQERADGPGVVVSDWLRQTGAGRLVLTLMAAGVIWLLALGRRTLAPVFRIREERRSALEHVDALATAWQSVRGTRTVARLLARGIRRRHAGGRWRSLDDAAFLEALATRHPAISDDVARLTRAMASPAAPTDLPALRSAAAHIDAECLAP
jgi:hypothetical protein